LSVAGPERLRSGGEHGDARLPARSAPADPGARPTALVLPAVAAAGLLAFELLRPGLEGALGPVPALLLGLAGVGGAVAAAGWFVRRGAPGAAAPAADPVRLETHEKAERMRAIVATATEGIVTIDERGTIETFNGSAERMFGWAAADVIGRNVAMLMPPPYRDEHDGYIRRYLDTGQARVIGIGREVAGRRRDGSVFPIDLSVGEGFAGPRHFFIAIIRDISDRKDMQAKLAQAERLAAVGELAAGVAHEVNNPINTVINCAQLIQDGDDVASNAKVITEEGQRIAAIVQDLLRFARDDRDQPQATAIPEVVERTLRLIGESFKRHGIRLQVEFADDLPLVKARPQQLQQVLLNLLINAKDALLHEAGGRPREVRLSAESTAEAVALRVADNGPGIPTQLGERIFEPFVTTKRARGGTGLGLSISRSIVEGYGGTLTVRSEPGRGAEFQVRLPRSTESRDQVP
jgi:PAS domain S-box-containing protein